MLGWLRTVGRPPGPTPIGPLCDLLEYMARLALLKARRVAGGWEMEAPEERAWEGPPAELAPRRAWLAERIAEGCSSFGGPARSLAAVPAMLLPIQGWQLRAAMTAVLEREERPVSLVSGPPPRASVEQYATAILNALARRDQVSLKGIAGRARHEQVAAFLACLTLTRQGRITLTQETLFADVVIANAVPVEVEATA